MDVGTSSRAIEPSRRWIMKLMRRCPVVAGVTLVLASSAIVYLWLSTSPDPFPPGSQSAARLEAGSFSVATADFEWVDTERQTPSSGDFPGASDRSLPSTIWYPEGTSGPLPLLVYSHGFLSTRRGGAYLARHLASHGYVVVAADFPLTTPRASGTPDPRDVVNQPGDVSFLIDQILAMGESERPFEGTIDTRRIGVFGLSLGGVTSTLVAFHPNWRDPRVAAAISLAGPADVLGVGFYDQADVPFLMIAGTADRIIDYKNNALPVVERAATGALLTFVGGTHLGFDDVATGLMRIFGDPDGLVCRAAAFAGNEALDPEENIFDGLFGSTEQGLIEPDDFTPACSRTFHDVLGGGRQHMLTKLAVRSFFESHFASDSESRKAHARFLTETLPQEIAEVTYSSSRIVRPRPADRPSSASVSKGVSEADSQGSW